MKTPPLFSANGPVGCGARAEPEFATGRDLLRHMDRLGIRRSLVWNTQARDHHPAQGNRQLLADLDALDPRRERLVPSFVIAPTMLYEADSVAELTRALRSGRVRALRIFPGTLRHKLRHLDPLLKPLVRFKPVLFVDIRDGTEYDDLLRFAETFPRTPIVCMHGMWPHIFNFSLLDLLRRRPNILIDNSWLHCRGTMEMIVRDFGIHRVVFAIGPKSHNGAAIGHLQHARITADERERIAHRNLEKLLGLEPTTVSQPPVAPTRASGSLWKQFLDRGKVGVEIIDAHGHLGAVGFWPMREREVEDQIPAALREMDLLGIRTMIVSVEDALFGDPVEGNRKLERLAGRYRGRFQGYFAFNPFYDRKLIPLFDDCFSRSFFVGFKILCGYWGIPVTDPRFEPAYRYANRHRLPILFHTWDGPYDQPGLLKDIVKRHPHAIFLLGHSGGGDRGRPEAEELARANRNVYLEWCGSFCSRIPWEETLARVGERQVVFGTDGLFHDFAWELGRFLSLDVPDRKLLPILGENLRRILKMRR